MQPASIQLPADCIEQTAASVASGHKAIATVWFWLDGLFALGGIAFLTGKPTADLAATAFGFGFWVALFTWLAVRSLRKARRATAAGRLATDPSVTWFLNGKMIVAARDLVPQPAHSFKISGKLRTVLTAVPRAEIVAR